MIKIFTVANVSDDLAKAWLQHLRDFDTAHPGCHFEVLADAPDKSISEIIDIMRVNPGLTFSKFFERDPAMRDLLGELNMGHCPDCKTGGWPFEDGPRGGLSQNITCTSCGSRFNVAPRWPNQRRDIPLFHAERI